MTRLDDAMKQELFYGKEECTEFHSLLGMLHWLAATTMPKLVVAHSEKRKLPNSGALVHTQLPSPRDCVFKNGRQEDYDICVVGFGKVRLVLENIGLVRERQHGGTGMCRLRAQVQTTGESRGGVIQMDAAIRGPEQMDAAIVAVATTVTRIGSETEGGYESPEETIRTDRMAGHIPTAQRKASIRVCGIARRQTRELALLQVVRVVGQQRV
jgi:hypothetical protein